MKRIGQEPRASQRRSGLPPIASFAHVNLVSVFGATQYAGNLHTDSTATVLTQHCGVPATLAGSGTATHYHAWLKPGGLTAFRLTDVP